ncbi:DNA polymerase III subunit delta' [Acetobacter sp. DsW_063]|uniref:DNA polymerase III subunit delta' n=1 Tax=Acetobacter sp. DsW_063 TaxID=1514894 RepID=UPI000A3833E9|nr:DNA polymerase III subunit delta' [Acetobacter sp. DsW_063]
MAAPRGSRSKTASAAAPIATEERPLDKARRASMSLTGHQASLAAFRNAFATGRLHHAWLLTGPEGIGKAALAFRMARILLNGEDEASSAGRQVTAGSHPDLLAIGRSYDEKKQRFRGEIVADEIRPIGAFLHRTAAEGGWRVVLVDNVDTMNRNAANALLKVLEEPPNRAILLLTCATPGRLLPTIRSRCRTLTVPPLDDASVRAVLMLEASDAEPSEIERVLPLAQGSPGRAIALLADKGGALAGVAQEALAGMSVARMLDVAEGISRSDVGFPLFFTLLANALASATRRAGRLEESAALAERWTNVGRIRSETERFNLDKQEAVIEALSVAGGH